MTNYVDCRMLDALYANWNVSAAVTSSINE